MENPEAQPQRPQIPNAPQLRLAWGLSQASHSLRPASSKLLGADRSPHPAPSSTPSLLGKALAPCLAPTSPSVGVQPCPLCLGLLRPAPGSSRSRSALCQARSLLTTWEGDGGRDWPLGSAEGLPCAQGSTFAVTGNKAKFLLLLRKS